MYYTAFLIIQNICIFLRGVARTLVISGTNVKDNGLGVVGTLQIFFNVSSTVELFIKKLKR